MTAAVQGGEDGRRVGVADLVPPALLARIEERYWRGVERVSSLEAVLADDAFLVDPDRHLGLFSDHGVVHVRDVAARAASLALTAQGALLEPRSPERSDFVQGCAVLLAYLHDIGMSPENPDGRSVHAHFAAQTAFAASFDDLADELWASDAGGLRSRLEQVARSAPLAVPLCLAAREVLALCFAHSKSAVPAEVLDDPVALRSAVQRAVLTPLDVLAGREGAGRGASAAAGRYAELGADPAMSSFAWLVDGAPAARLLAQDAVDAVRVLRAADALRQRGTALRTSAGFEVCTSRRDGSGVFAMRTADTRVSVLVQVPGALAGAEADLRQAELTHDGALRVAVHVGRWPTAEVARDMAAAMARTVLDIARDALDSFRPTAPAGGWPVQVVRPHDEPAFADAVVGCLVSAAPDWAGRVEVVDEPPADLPPDVVDWAARGTPVAASGPGTRRLLARLAACGMRPPDLARQEAFAGVRRVRLSAGEQVLAPGTAASVVLLPLGPGLVVAPSGGYPAAPLQPWHPVGVTGVVRGGERNAEVRAAAPVEVVAVPAEVFLTHWFRPLAVHELRAAAAQWGDGRDGGRDAP